MPLINCEINLFLTWSTNCFIVGDTFINQVPVFAMTDTKLHAPVVTLSIYQFVTMEIRIQMHN